MAALTLHYWLTGVYAAAIQATIPTAHVSMPRRLTPAGCFIAPKAVKPVVTHIFSIVSVPVGGKAKRYKTLE